MSDVLASIMKGRTIKGTNLKTFEELKVEVTYDIYKEEIEGFLLGVAHIYTWIEIIYLGRIHYLEKIDIPNTFGRHKVVYKIPKMPLLGGHI